jgi:hypothetical protein
MSGTDFCVRTLFLRKLLREGRIVAAKQQAAQWLREGYATSQFLTLMAEILVTPSRKRVHRRLTPRWWTEIRQAFQALRDEGFIQTQAVLILADKYNRSPRAIQKALEHFLVVEDRYTPPPGSSGEVNKGSASA